MDDRRFDAFVRALATGQSRRSVLKGLLGIGGAAAIGASRLAPETEAARRPTPTVPPTTHKCPGRQTWNGSQCICPAGLITCGSDCCAPGVSTCCDNACCFGECYGEELCCPNGRAVCNGTCCPAGEVCFQGACRRCTLCGDNCCSGDTPQCCHHDETSICTPASATCCAADSDCHALGFCDGQTAHTFTCVNAVCTESAQNCQGTDSCYTYNCNQGVCGSTRIEGCCTSSDQCTAVDACTPAQCLEDHTCNKASSCFSDEHCCSGTCASTDDRCCTSDDDCADLDFCSNETLDAYHYTCVGHVCTRQDQDCQGSAPCTQYGCSQGQCTATFLCASDEICCDDDTCSLGGLCGGCTIDGVYFPPCVTGCSVCVAPNGGTQCGCGVRTPQDCESSDICKELFTNAICTGPPGSGNCVQSSGPIGPG